MRAINASGTLMSSRVVSDVSSSLGLYSAASRAWPELIQKRWYCLWRGRRAPPIEERPGARTRITVVSRCGRRSRRARDGRALAQRRLEGDTVCQNGTVCYRPTDRLHLESAHDRRPDRLAFRRARRHPLSVGDPVRAGPSRLLGARSGPASPGRRVVIGIVALLAAHLRHRRRLPSLLLASRLLRPAAAFQFVLAFLCPEHRPEERAVVGGQAPPPPPPFRHRARRAFAAPQRLRLQPCRLDLRPPARRQPTSAKVGDFARYPGTDVAAPVRARARRSSLRVSAS